MAAPAAASFVLMRNAPVLHLNAIEPAPPAADVADDQQLKPSAVPAPEEPDGQNFL